MNDDYLWDGSGDPDPDVEHLERLLRRYRYQPRELHLHDRPKGARFMRYALVASLALAALAAGLWIGRLRHESTVIAPPMTSTTPNIATTPEDPVSQPRPSPVPDENPSQRIARNLSAKRSYYSGEFRIEDSDPEFFIISFFDFETARHLEQTQILLRSFKNASFSKDEAADAIAYEKQLARDLLIKNVLLRRDAETERNLPVKDLLNTLEPFLLDIANLQDAPSQDEVRSIQERIQKKEIIAALQLYSTVAMNPTL